MELNLLTGATYQRPVASALIGKFGAAADSGDLLRRHQAYAHVHSLRHNIHARIKLQRWGIAIGSPGVDEHLPCYANSQMGSDVDYDVHWERCVAFMTNGSTEHLKSMQNRYASCVRYYSKHDVSGGIDFSPVLVSRDFMLTKQ